MISPSILQTLGQLLSTKVDYCTKIMHKKSAFYLAVGTNKLYLFKEDLDTIIAMVEYQHIARIIVSTQMHMNEKKNPNVPNKMNIHTLNRRHLVRYIVYAWKSDFLFRNLEVRDMPLYKKEFDDPAGYSLLKGPMLALMLPQESQSVKTFVLDSYRFWMPKDFSEAKEKGIYNHSQDKTCKINIQISETQPLEVLNLIGDRYDLQFYAEQFADLLVIQELAEYNTKVTKKEEGEDEEDEKQETPDDEELKEDEEVIPEGSNRVKDYWIMYSSPYVKRENIVNDGSEWSGWEVNIRTQKRTLIVLMMRRKYLPPMMENFDDIIIVFYGPIGKDSLIEEQQKAPHQQEEEEEEENAEEDEEASQDAEAEAKKAKDDEVLLKAFDEILKGQEFTLLVRDIADTFQSIYDVIETYEPLIKLNVSTLMLDDKTMKFYHLRLQQIPKYIVYAVCVLNWILDQAIENIADSQVYKKVRESLNKEYSKEMRDNSDLVALYNPKDKLADFWRKVSAQNFDQGSKRQLQGPSKRIWMYKLSRYFTYCLNGGLCGKKFNFQQYFAIIDNNQIKRDLRDQLVEFLDFLLHASPEQAEAAEYQETNLVKRLQKMVGQRYYYNEKVMNALLKYDYLSTHFLKGEQPQLYTEILISLLNSARSSKLKKAVCRHIIKFQHGAKETMNEVILNQFKPLVSRLLQAFQSPNRQLSTLACVALFNMCAASREFKYLIMKEDGARILMEKIFSKDANQQAYTLKLIHTLLSVVQHVEKFLSMDIINAMFNIIAGVDIPGAYYSVQSLTSVCQILKVCITNDYNFQDMEAATKLLIKLYVEDANKYVIDQRLYYGLQQEALSVIGKLCLQNKKLKDLANKELIYMVLDAVTGPQPSGQAGIDRIEKLVFFLCIMIQDRREFRDEWKERCPLLEDAIACFEARTPTVPNAAYLMKELTAEEEKKKKDQ